MSDQKEQLDQLNLLADQRDALERIAGTLERLVDALIRFDHNNKGREYVAIDTETHD